MGHARSGQNFVTSAAIYFTIQKYLGETAYFPIPPEYSNNNCYEKQYDVSSGAHIAKFSTYMALHPDGGNKDYNIVDNDPKAPTFRDFWESFGEYFGVPVATKVGYHAGDDAEAKIKRGVWKEIAEKYGVDPKAPETYGITLAIDHLPCRRADCRTGTFYMFHWIMALGDWGCWASMEKARKEIGWTEHTDSREECRKVFDAMRAEGAIPKDM